MAEPKQPKQTKKRANTAKSAVKPVTLSKPRAFRDMFFSRNFGIPLGSGLFCIVFYAVIQALPSSFTRPINENTAWSLGMVLNTFGIPALHSGDTVTEGKLAFAIIPECTPIFAAGLFLSCVLFYPSTLSEKLTGLLAGLPALYVGNLARLTATFMISRYDQRLFGLVHVYLGQVFTIFLVILVCITWLKWCDRKESGRTEFGKTTGFTARFALISSGLFLVWMHVHHWYIWFLDQIVLLGFSLFDYHPGLARMTEFYYETFSIIVFVSVMLAVRSIPRPLKIRGLAAGLGVLFLMHLLHRIDNVLMVYFRCPLIMPADMTLLIVGQYLLPVLILIAVFRYKKDQSNHRLS
jgi:exosortase H (IPTLxxWG-CTERM-specific)